MANLIGHWRFDETSGTNAVNEVATGDGNAVGEGTVSWNPVPGDGKFGGYVTLDGFSGFLCDNESSFDVSGKEVTLMLWVRTPNTDNWYLPILSKGDGTAYDMELLFGQMIVQVDGVGATLYGETPEVRDGDWHHLCAVLGPPTNKTYVDGIVYDVAAHNGNDLGMNNSPVGLGWIDGVLREINGMSSSLTGDMDDAAVFNKALSQAEILDVMNNGVPTSSTSSTSTTTTSSSSSSTDSTTTTSTTTTSTTTTLGLANLIGHWRFDEASGNYARNDSGTGDGNAIGDGFVWWNPSPGDGKFGGYVTLDGFSGFLCDNESNFDVNGKAVTFMTWVRSSNTDGWYLPILTKGDDTSFDMELLFGQIHVQVDGVGSTLHSASPNVIDGNWHHLCAVIGPPTNSTYVDGVLCDVEEHNDSDLGLNNTPIGLGWVDGFMRKVEGMNRSLIGDMDDAAIFDRALKQAEIQNIIDNGVPTTTTTTSTTTTTTTSTTTTTTTFSFLVPYEESFEQYIDGAPIADINGWIGLLHAASVSTDANALAKLSNYSKSGLDYPIEWATHNKILCVDTSHVISNRISTGIMTVFADLLWLPVLGNAPRSDSNDQLAMYVNSNGRLTIWHDDSGTYEYHELVGSPAIGISEWIRITIEQNYSGNRYRLSVNESEPISDAKGWNAPFGGTQPGPWFTMVQKNGFMSGFSVHAGNETTCIDDLQVEFENPAITEFEEWSEQFNLPSDEDGPEDDPDGDGATNSEEWNAGTNPNDSSEVFEITAIERLIGSNCVTWVYGTDTTVTTPFTIWRATSLNDLVYEVIQTGIPRDSSAKSTFYDTDQTARAPEYRVVINPKTDP